MTNNLELTYKDGFDLFGDSVYDPEDLLTFEQTPPDYSGYEAEVRRCAEQSANYCKFQSERRRYYNGD